MPDISTLIANIYIYIYVCRYNNMSVVVTYTKASMGRAKYHLIIDIFKKQYWSSTLLRVSCIEHSSGVHFY